MAKTILKDFKNGNITICVRGHSNAIGELILPPVVMNLVNWKDGDRVEIVQSETYIEPSTSSKVILGLGITKVDDAKLLDESEVV